MSKGGTPETDRLTALFEQRRAWDGYVTDEARMLDVLVQVNLAILKRLELDRP